MRGGGHVSVPLGRAGGERILGSLFTGIKTEKQKS